MDVKNWTATYIVPVVPMRKNVNVPLFDDPFYMLFCQMFNSDGHIIIYFPSENDFSWSDDFGIDCPWFLDEMMELHQ